MNGSYEAMQARKLARRQLGVTDVAALLDHRLYALPPTQDATRDGCAHAARAGFAAVICRPERVGEAARELVGTTVAVVTALGWDIPDTAVMETSMVLNQAHALADQGVNEVALVASRERLAGGGIDFTR